MMIDRIFLIGNGPWGQALSSLLNPAMPLTWVFRSHAKKEHMQDQLARSGSVVPINFSSLDEQLNLTSNSLVIIAIASEGVSSFVQEYLMPVKPYVLMTSKGLNKTTQKLHSRLLEDLQYPMDKVAVLAGASYAEEIMANRSTLVTLASANKDYLEKIEEIFSAKSTLSCEHHHDIKTVELWGVIKNLIACASGFFYNKEEFVGSVDRNLLLYGCLKELELFLYQHYGVWIFDNYHYSAGIGDTYLSSTSTQSRNYRYGVSMARGRLEDHDYTIEVKNTIEFLKEQDLSNSPILRAFLFGHFNADDSIYRSCELSLLLLQQSKPNLELSEEWVAFLQEQRFISSKNHQASNLVTYLKTTDLRQQDYLMLVVNIIEHSHRLKERVEPLRFSSVLAVTPSSDIASPKHYLKK
ncbi:hypothetical protein EBR43_03010 [bacterium]|nr:hypothetical protein [bacterium]NBX71785.1 hypothetical protein [bacterium]